jgi:hypothetical protein
MFQRPQHRIRASMTIPAAIGRVDQHLHRPLPVFLRGRLRR